MHSFTPRRVTLACAGGLLGGACALAACGGAPAGALAGKSASQILSTALAAAGTQRGVQYAIVGTTSTTSSEKQTIEGDAGASEGLQQVVTGSDHVEVELLSDTAYFMGDAGGLQNILGLSASVSTAYADRWISVTSAESLFHDITEAVTTKGIFAELAPTGTLRASGPGKVDGRQAMAVTGGLPGIVARGVTGSATVYVSTTHPDLPVAFQANAANSTEKVTDVGVFDRWGERLALTVPSGAIPYSSLPSS